MEKQIVGHTAVEERRRFGWEPKSKVSDAVYVPVKLKGAGFDCPMPVYWLSAGNTAPFWLTVIGPSGVLAVACSVKFTGIGLSRLMPKL